VQTLVDSKSVRSVLGRVGWAVECLPRFLFRRRVQILIDATLSTLAIWFAYQLRFDFHVPPAHQVVMWTWALLLFFLRPLCLLAMGIYRGTWRYFNFDDAIAFTTGAMPVTVLMLLMRVASGSVFGIRVPLIVIVVDCTCFLMLGLGLRAVRRLLYKTSLGHGSLKRTLLVGTEFGLVSGLRQIDMDPDLMVVGLLAPDVKLAGDRISGFAVIGTPNDLSKHLASGQVDLVLVADSDLSCVGDTVATSMEFGVEARLLPSPKEIISGDVRVSARPSAEGALGNGPNLVLEPHPLVMEAFRKRTVLITGAGGSIGSELSRQVAHLPVKRVLLLDQDENAMFNIHTELTRNNPNTLVVPLVADIRDNGHLRSIFAKYGPQVVLHAAAYKHVPVMEHNCSEAVLNNVIGTRNLLELAVEFDAERFLLISTDKAVNPSSMMGATKRMAEMLVQYRARRSNGHVNRTRCTCVRFGNVAGSNGSVIPIFLKQIAAGGPVTITSEEMTRYFMTIPEAVQLVLQAASIDSTGEIYLLDMGDPIKIKDLARRLIQMSGLRPDIDIPIQITGLRPGEKLHEKLWSDSTQVYATAFPRVLNVHPVTPPADFSDDVQRLESAAYTRDDLLTRRTLMTMPIDFGFIQAPADLDKSWRLDIPFPEIESKALINKSASA
jgi:FlaA1/EpsC-like NDP-sugar epimerase